MKSKHNFFSALKDDLHDMKTYRSYPIHHGLKINNKIKEDI